MMSRFLHKRALNALTTVILVAMAASVSTSATLYGILIEDDSTKWLVTIDPASGVASKVRESTTVGMFSTGVSAFDESNATLYFSANAPGEERRRLFSINVLSGRNLNSPLIAPVDPTPTPTLYNTTPICLFEWVDTVYGMWARHESRKEVASIDPSSGATSTWIGDTVSMGGYSSGVAAFDSSAALLYVAGQAGGLWRIYTFDVTAGSGNVIHFVAISPPSGYEAMPAFLESDGAGTLYGIFKEIDQPGMILATIDVSTGSTTPVGSGFSADGFSSGVSCIDPGANRLYFAACQPDTADRSIYTVNTTTGALEGSPATITSADGLDTTPLLLACTASVSSGAPGHVPLASDVPGNPLMVQWNSGGSDLDLSWDPSCESGATDYAVYAGTLGTYYDHASVTCSTSGATAATITPGSGDEYYLVVPLTASQEGGYGIDSSGAQRPQGSGACQAAQDTSPCP